MLVTQYHTWLPNRVTTLLPPCMSDHDLQMGSSTASAERRHWGNHLGQLNPINLILTNFKNLVG